MFNAKHRRMAFGLGFFLVPIVLVKLVGFLLGSPGPSSAQADAAAAAPTQAAVIGAAKPAEFAATTVAAAQHARTLRSQSFAPSPFYYVSRPATETEPAEPTLADGVDFESLSKMVQLIMSSPQGDIVMMDGRTIRVGEVLDGADWTIDAIDARKGTVVFREISTGRTMTHAVAPKLP